MTTGPAELPAAGCHRLAGATRGRRAAAVALVVGAGALAGCGTATASKPVPTPTTQFHIVAAGYPPAKVLGWVRTTLENGASLVTMLPPTATDAEVAASAQQLGVACGVATKELTQTTWTGRAHGDEAALAGTVVRINALVAGPPAGLGAALRPELATMANQLTTLQRDV